MQIRVVQKSAFKKKIYVVLILIAFLICVASGVQASKRKMMHDLLSVSFPTEQEGWACGRLGTILHTSDGGSTWAVQKSGTKHTLSSISFVDNKTGWVVGDRGTILHTKDGGQNWINQKSPVSNFLMGVQFIDGKKGWAVGEKTTILHTKDGGQSWSVQFRDRDFILKKISFCDEENGWAVGEYGFIYHTQNGGQTWLKQAGEFRFSEDTGDVEGGNFLFDVMAVDPKKAWVVGIDSYIAETIDGGRIWKQVKGPMSKNHLFAIASDREGNVFIGGNSLLIATSDYGKTFRQVKTQPPLTYGWVYDIAQRDRKGLVAVGKDGSIYLGNNTEESWRQVNY